MKHKLQDLYSPSNMVGSQAANASKMNQLGINTGGPGQASQDRASIQYRKELDGYIKQEYGKQESLTREYFKQKVLLKEREELYTKQVKGSELELKLAKELVKEKERLARIESQRRTAEQNTSQGLDIKRQYQESISTLGYKKGGMSKDEIDALDAESNRLRGGGLGGKAKGVAIAAGAVAGVVKIVEQLAGYNQRLEGARGSAVEGTTGRDLSNVYSGRSPFEAAWVPEREKAAGLAEQKKFWNRITDRAMGVVGAGLVLSGGAMALTGVGLPAAGVAAAAGGALLANDRSRKGILGGSGYEQLLASQQTQDFWSNLESMKKQDPRKRLGFEHFEQNYMGDLQAQRTLGLSNAGYYGSGGLLARGAGAGFTRDMTRDMAQQIIGAGGSARMGQQGEFGLQMQRSGLTNASSILGNLSGSLQSPETSKNAVIRIMSEAFKIGLDNSDYVEENRRFTQVASEVIGRVGAATSSGQGAIAGNLGMFVGERTNAGIQNARTAYEEFQQRGSQVGGRRGIMRYSQALQNRNLSRLSSIDLTELLSMRPEDLQASPAALSYFTQAAGYSNSGDLIKDMSDIQKKTRIEVPGVRSSVDKYASQISTYMKNQGLSWSQFTQMATQGSGAGPGALPSDILSAVGGLGIKGNVGEGAGYSDRLGFARAGEFIKNAGGLSDDQLDLGNAQNVLSGPSGRIEDEYVGKIASSADAVRTTFNELKGALTNAIVATDGLANSAVSSGSKQQSANDARRSGLPSGDAYQGNARAATQGQATSSPSVGNGYKGR